MKRLCVYCTRTDNTATIAKAIAQKLNAELLFITDGKDRKGVFGYISTAIEQLKNRLPALLPINIEHNLSEYDEFVVAFPIWCEDVCIIAKSFLDKYKTEIKGDIYYVATHMSSISYDKKMNNLSAIVGKDAKKCLSVQTRKHDWTDEVDDFAKSIL